MRREWKELQGEEGKHFKETEQHVHKGSEHDIHVGTESLLVRSRWTSGQGQPKEILPGYDEDFVIMKIEFFEVFETVNVRPDCKKLRWMQEDQLEGLGERILLRARGEQNQKDQMTRTYTSPTFFSSNVFSLFYPSVLSY